MPRGMSETAVNNSDNSDNLMKINKNMAKLDKKIFGEIIID